MEHPTKPHFPRRTYAERSRLSSFNKGLWWAVQDSNLRPPACKAGALTS